MLSVRKVTLTLVIFLNHFRQSCSQDLIRLPLPLGQFRFISPFNGFGIPLLTTTTPSNVQNSIFDRPRVDTSVPAGVDAAKIAAQGAAIIAFIRACPRVMELAGLGCPCGHPGGRCADQYSLCSLSNKCVCDGRLGYPAATGKSCIPYVTSTTKVPTTRTTTITTNTPTTITTTRPTTTTATITSSTTITSTSTTTTATTTTTTVLTTLPPTETIDTTDCSGTAPTRMFPTSDTYYEIISDSYPSVTQPGARPLCEFPFQPPSGKRVKIEFVELDIMASLRPGGNCISGILAGSNPPFCNANPPPGTPPTFTFAVNQLALTIIILPRMDNGRALDGQFKNVDTKCNK